MYGAIIYKSTLSVAVAAEQTNGTVDSLLDGEEEVCASFMPTIDYLEVMRI